MTRNNPNPPKGWWDYPTPILDKITGCILWQGPLDQYGYGKFKGAGAHREAYELWIGPIPVGYSIDHVYKEGCRYKHCINPKHLEAVPPGENTRRANLLRPTQEYCPNGHRYETGSFHLEKKSWGYARRCKECKENNRYGRLT